MITRTQGDFAFDEPNFQYLAHAGSTFLTHHGLPAHARYLLLQTSRVRHGLMPTSIVGFGQWMGMGHENTLAPGAC